LSGRAAILSILAPKKRPPGGNTGRVTVRLTTAETGTPALNRILERLRHRTALADRLLSGERVSRARNIMTKPAEILSERVTFSCVTDADFEELVALRIAAMRESLERVGRFDPERARERLRRSFYPEHTEFIVLDGQRIGFYTFRPAGDGFRLDHLYVHPGYQCRGVGSHIICYLLVRSDARQMPVHLAALRDSPSNRFYRRHGFLQTAEDEGDIYYVRKPSPNESSFRH
jgi:GNAT superfamily N-acetyltransferase